MRRLYTHRDVFARLSLRRPFMAARTASQEERRLRVEELLRTEDVDEDAQHAQRGEAPIHADVVQRQQQEGVGIAVEEVARAELAPAGGVEEQHGDHDQAERRPERGARQAALAVAREEEQEE